jgi:hypothetical protein
MRPVIKSVSLVKLATLVVLSSVVSSGFIGLDSFVNSIIFTLGIIVLLLAARWIGLIGEINTDEGARYFNWINWAIAALAITVITGLAWQVWDISVAVIWAIIIGALLVIGTAIYLDRAFRKTKKVEIDERTRDITNKSARNAFIMVLWGLLLSGSSDTINSESTTITSDGTYIVTKTSELVNPLDAEKLLIVVTVALLVFVASLYIYRHKANLSGGKTSEIY